MIQREPVASLVARLNMTDESEELEAKEQSGDIVSKTVYETICALSNEPELGGGTILLGVDKEQSLFPLYTVTDVINPDKLSSDIASACSTQYNQPIRVDITPSIVDGKIVLKIDVEELPKAQKPVYFRSSGLPRGAYRRIGPTDVRCTDEDLLLFFQGRSSDPFDVRIERDASLSDLDDSAIGAYRSARREANPLAEELNWSDEDLLFSLGAVKWVDDKLRVTATGLLTFGKPASLRRLYPMHRVDYIRVAGTQWFKDAAERLESIDMRGPLMTLISRVISAVQDDLPRTLDVEGGRQGQRAEIPVLPYRVIRESVVNALMHRSYQTNRPTQIIRYANRLVITNSGFSLKSQERFDKPGSELRNPTIAAIMHETRFAEAKGSGIRVMQAKMKENGLASPTFESDRDADEFTATFLFHHFLNEEDWAWLSRFADLSLSEDQMRALIFVREVGAIDNSTYRSLTHADTLAASKSLRTLREMNLLEDRGSGARTHYVAGVEMHQRETKPSPSPLASEDGSSHDSDPNMDGSSHVRNAVRPQDVPPPLRKKIAAFTILQRATAEEAQALIIELCDWRTLSAFDLANLLRRGQVYLSQKYITPILKQGKLSYLYPEMIQHPEQKYITSKTPTKKRPGIRSKGAT